MHRTQQGRQAPRYAALATAMGFCNVDARTLRHLGAPEGIRAPFRSAQSSPRSPCRCRFAGLALHGDIVPKSEQIVFLPLDLDSGAAPLQHTKATHGGNQQPSMQARVRPGIDSSEPKSTAPPLPDDIVSTDTEKVESRKGACTALQAKGIWTVSGLRTGAVTHPWRCPTPR